MSACQAYASLGALRLSRRFGRHRNSGSSNVMRCAALTFRSNRLYSVQGVASRCPLSLVQQVLHAYGPSEQQLARLTSATRFVLSGNDPRPSIVTSSPMLRIRLHAATDRPLQRRTSAPTARRACQRRVMARGVVTRLALSTPRPGGHGCGDRRPAGAITRSRTRSSIQRRVRVGPAPPPR